MSTDSVRPDVVPPATVASTGGIELTGVDKAPSSSLSVESGKRSLPVVALFDENNEVKGVTFRDNKAHHVLDYGAVEVAKAVLILLSGALLFIPTIVYAALKGNPFLSWNSLKAEMLIPIKDMNTQESAQFLMDEARTHVASSPAEKHIANTKFESVIANVASEINKTTKDRSEVTQLIKNLRTEIEGQTKPGEAIGLPVPSTNNIKYVDFIMSKLTAQLDTLRSAEADRLVSGVPVGADAPALAARVDELRTPLPRGPSTANADREVGRGLPDGRTGPTLTPAPTGIVNPKLSGNTASVNPDGSGVVVTTPTDAEPSSLEEIQARQKAAQDKLDAAAAEVEADRVAKLPGERDDLRGQLGLDPTVGDAEKDLPTADAMKDAAEQRVQGEARDLSGDLGKLRELKARLEDQEDHISVHYKLNQGLTKHNPIEVGIRPSPVTTANADKYLENQDTNQQRATQAVEFVEAQQGVEDSYIRKAGETVKEIRALTESLTKQLGITPAELNKKLGTLHQQAERLVAIDGELHPKTGDDSAPRALASPDRWGSAKVVGRVLGGLATTAGLIYSMMPGSGSGNGSQGFGATNTTATNSTEPYVFGTPHQFHGTRTDNLYA